LLLVGCSNLVQDNKEVVEENDHQTALCHTAGDGSFSLLAESRAEWPAHLLHGDGITAGPVPGMDGFVFSATCQAVKDSDEGPCPSGMAHIDGFCIDRWEAHLSDHSPYTVPQAGVAQTGQGVIPQGYISGEVAEAACQAVGKRLCRSAEWLRACQGPSEETFPYGDTYIPTACNEGREQHPVIELFGDQTDWSSRQMNDPRINQLADGLEVTGSHPVCMSAEGVFDLHGNLHEWVADAEGTFRGGFYVDAKINGPGCRYRTTAHGRTYHDYSTGFRCCSDAQ
jgi:hypothetical protein